MKRYGVKAEPVKKRINITLVGVADIRPLAVANQEYFRIIFLQKFHSFFEFLYSFISPRFVESNIGFECSSIFVRFFYSPFVKCKLREFHFRKTLRNFRK